MKNALKLRGTLSLLLIVALAAQPIGAGARGVCEGNRADNAGGNGEHGGCCASQAASVGRDCCCAAQSVERPSTCCGSWRPPEKDQRSPKSASLQPDAQPEVHLESCVCGAMPQPIPHRNAAEPHAQEPLESGALATFAPRDTAAAGIRVTRRRANHHLPCAPHFVQRHLCVWLI